jgi:hypothetical protein
LTQAPPEKLSAAKTDVVAMESLPERSHLWWMQYSVSTSAWSDPSPKISPPYPVDEQTSLALVNWCSGYWQSVAMNAVPFMQPIELRMVTSVLICSDFDSGSIAVASEDQLVYSSWRNPPFLDCDGGSSTTKCCHGRMQIGLDEIIRGCRCTASINEASSAVVFDDG